MKGGDTMSKIVVALGGNALGQSPKELNPTDELLNRCNDIAEKTVVKSL